MNVSKLFRRLGEIVLIYVLGSIFLGIVSVLIQKFELVGIQIFYGCFEKPLGFPFATKPHHVSPGIIEACFESPFPGLLNYGFWFLLFLCLWFSLRRILKKT